MAATSNQCYPNANSDYNANSQNCDRNLSIFFVVLAAFVVAGIIALYVALHYHPDFPEFSVSGFEVSNFSLTSNSLTSNFNVSVAVRNPNKRSSIRYDEIHASVLYSTGDAGDAVLYRDDFVIAEAAVFPFTQRPRNVTDLKVKSGTVGSHINDEDRIRSGDGEVRFGVRVSSTVWFKAGAWKSAAYYDVKVYCDDVRVGLKNSTAAAGFGSMVGPAKGCEVWDTCIRDCE